jgi:hypothetical protein
MFLPASDRSLRRNIADTAELMAVITGIRKMRACLALKLGDKGGNPRGSKGVLTLSKDDAPKI